VARHTSQNRFAGTSNARQAPKKGGVQYVEPEQTIGVFSCWCQGDICKNGWWPDQDKGAPHPREPFSVTEGESVTVMTEAPHIVANQLKAFQKPIAALITHVVNNCGIKYRVVDGGTIMLFPPDGESRPFKVSAKRTVEVNNQILREQFMKQYDIITPEAWKEARRLDHAPEPEPVSEPQVEVFTSEPTPVEPRPVQPLPWKNVFGDGGKLLRIEMRSPTEWRCKVCQAPFGNRKAASAHLRAHPAYAEQPDVKPPLADGDVQAALTILAAHVGVDIGEKRIDELEEELADLNRQNASLLSQVERLQTDYDAMVKKAQDAEAAMDLLRETFATIGGKS
jgi:hypothetical protein